MRLDNFKPMSVNHAWRGGKRYLTDDYRVYKEVALILLKPLSIPVGPLKIRLEFGVSNTNCDIDNFVKPFLDILQAKYQFNDNRFMEAHLLKTLVPKGQEYIEFEIEKWVQNVR